jgi:hypothetical protein
VGLLSLCVSSPSEVAASGRSCSAKGSAVDIWTTQEALTTCPQ